MFQLTIQAQSVDVLFLGNSYTFYNNMPNLISQIALSLDDTLNFESNTPGGWRLSDHAQENSSSIQAINQQSWDFVVIQAQSQEPSFHPDQVEEETYPFAQALVQTILSNDSCSEPMFFMTWGRKNGDAQNAQFLPYLATYLGMQNRLRESYLEMAYDNSCSVSPVGMAWKKSIEENPDFELFSADGSHPNLAGSYLSACVFYSSIYKKSCLGSDFIPDGLDSADVVNMQSIASSVVLDSTGVWNLFDVQNVEINNSGSNYDFNVQATNYDSISWDFGDGQSSNQLSVTHQYEQEQEYEAVLTVHSKNNCKQIEYSYSIDLQNVGLEDDSDLSANVFPNPAKEFVNIEINNRSKIELFSINGQLLISNFKSNSHRLNLSDFSRGTYLLKITNEYGVRYIKLLKSI